MLSREKHKTDESGNVPGVYAHIYIETLKKVNITNCERLHLKKDGKIFKGNYQSTKDKEKILNYILKDINSKDDENLLISKDLEIRLNPLIAKYEDFDKTIIRLIKTGRINEALELYKKEQLKEYHRSHMSLKKSFRDLFIKSLVFLQNIILILLL